MASQTILNPNGSASDFQDDDFDGDSESSSGDSEPPRKLQAPSLRQKAVSSGPAPASKQKTTPTLDAARFASTTNSSSIHPPAMRRPSPVLLPSPTSPSTSTSASPTATSSSAASPSPKLASPPTSTGNPEVPATLEDSSSSPVSAPQSEPNMVEKEKTRALGARLHLLQPVSGQQAAKNELSGTPVFTRSVLDHSAEAFSQYGFFAGKADVLDQLSASGRDASSISPASDPSIFFNISAPSSAFICGSQGSGKSHTLSVLLESCLLKLPDVNKLDNPLAALVFHYDSFISDLKVPLSQNISSLQKLETTGTPLTKYQRTYAGMNVEIEPLKINQNDLNTKRMLDLMAVNQDDGRMPLYLHEITRILRNMRVLQQQTNGSFNYGEFKRLVSLSPMTPAQKAPLTQRLDTLESFMPRAQVGLKHNQSANTTESGNDWSIKPGTLTIVDLSCPCVTSEGACALFNMCLSLFLEQKTNVGRVVALDEAHKYMNAGSEATSLTNTLLSCIRLQRHLGTRVFISTQEPSISPKLLDLCSVTIVHRFTSPDWLRCLRSHIAALDNDDGATANHKLQLASVFNQIVRLPVGQALLFAPSAITDLGLPEAGASRRALQNLGIEYLRIKIRARVTADGGASVMALGSQSSGLVSRAPRTAPAVGAPASAPIFGAQLAPANEVFEFEFSPFGASAQKARNR